MIDCIQALLKYFLLILIVDVIPCLVICIYDNLKMSSFLCRHIFMYVDVYRRKQPLLTNESPLIYYFHAKFYNLFKEIPVENTLRDPFKHVSNIFKDN